MSRRPPENLLDLVTVLGLTSGVSNIIMQLSLPPVGHGVNESRVVSGSPRRYPIKRARTTGQYLALALIGNATDRAVMRAAIVEVHNPVVSTPESPVRYSGNSPKLQKWVAACLFRFYLDQYTLLYGPLAPADLDILTRSASSLATGVNVRDADWPQSWTEFTEYWDSVVPDLSIAPEVCRDFESLADLTFVVEAWGPLARPLSRFAGPSYRFMTRANLPSEFRDLMGWAWSARDQRRFMRVLAVLRVIDRLGGGALVRLNYRVLLADFRLRLALGRPVLNRLRVSQEQVRHGGGRRRFARPSAESDPDRRRHLPA